jgi:hypothetical protein
MPRWLAATIIAFVALAAFAVGVHWGTFSAADSDPYGYVSQADLIAHGTLHTEQQFARSMPWPNGPATFTPPGYTQRPDGFLVPTYSPGLPMVMALFELVKGRDAVFYVVPALGALMVLMTGWLGARVDDPLTGVLAALVMSTSAIFVNQVIQPVSDVAAAAWWTVSLALVVLAGPRMCLLAGLAASLAILTRPNMAPLAAVLAVYLVWRNRRAAVLFCLGTIPGCLAVAVINDRLFGSPLMSGYGSLNHLYSWSNVGTNLIRYPVWLIEGHAAFLFLAIAAPWLSHTVRRDHVWVLAAFSIMTVLLYLPSATWPVHEWNYLRFILPAFPALTIMAVLVVRSIESWRLVELRVLGWKATAAVAIAAVATWQGSYARDVMGLQNVESRYVEVGQFAAIMLPKNAIYLTGTQTGSLRYYTGRLTLRLEQLNPGWLDIAVDELRRRGYHPYIVLEAGEEDWYRDKFGEQTQLGRLDWPAQYEREQPIVTRIYDPLDRAEFFHGYTVGTWNLPHIDWRPTISQR